MSACFAYLANRSRHVSPLWMALCCLTTERRSKKQIEPFLQLPKRWIYVQSCFESDWASALAVFTFEIKSVCDRSLCASGPRSWYCRPPSHHACTGSSILVALRALLLRCFAAISLPLTSMASHMTPPRFVLLLSWGPWRSMSVARYLWACSKTSFVVNNEKCLGLCTFIFRRYHFNSNSAWHSSIMPQRSILGTLQSSATSETSLVSLTLCCMPAIKPGQPVMFFCGAMSKSIQQR